MTYPRKLILATGNPGKLKELRRILAHLPIQVLGLADIDPIPEPDENGSTFAENARIKASCYANATGELCLADDSGLIVDALGDSPGVRSARYAQDAGIDVGDNRASVDQANTDRLLRELENVDDECRTARFVCHIAMADPERIVLETFDTVEGVIARERRGENGFGYDPVFLIADLGRTAAELSPEEKNAISHRGKAVRKFASLLVELFD